MNESACGPNSQLNLGPVVEDGVLTKPLQSRLSEHSSWTHLLMARVWTLKFKERPLEMKGIRPSGSLSIGAATTERLRPEECEISRMLRSGWFGVNPWDGDDRRSLPAIESFGGWNPHIDFTNVIEGKATLILPTGNQFIFLFL